MHLLVEQVSDIGRHTQAEDHSWKTAGSHPPGLFPQTAQPRSLHRQGFAASLWTTHELHVTGACGHQYLERGGLPSETQNMQATALYLPTPSKHSEEADPSLQPFEPRLKDYRAKVLD